jgi:hypothetical protein
MHAQEVFIMKAFRRSMMPAVLGISLVLAGCAMTPSSELMQDRALCKQARIERIKGDPQWVKSLDAIRDPYVAWYCFSYEMVWDRGGHPGE